MKTHYELLIKLGILKDDYDYHLIRASMVLILIFFGYQKWFPYEAQALIPYISHGPLIFWMYPVFGRSRRNVFLGSFGMAVWGAVICRILEQEIGILGALGSCASMIATSTIIPFMPDGWLRLPAGFQQ